MALTAVGVAAAVLTCCAISAAAPSLGDVTPQRPPTLPPVQYTLRASILPESLLVVAEMELQFRNTGNRNLAEICLLLPPPKRARCRIDSVLYRGAPLPDSLTNMNHSTIRISLPGDLPPGETGILLTSFRSWLVTSLSTPLTGQPLEFHRWFPLMCVYRQDQWFRGCRTNCGDWQADFNVALEIDSMYSIAHGGELLNEKEHYGLLPRPAGDTVLVDISARHSRDFEGRPFEPQFPDRRKQYYLRAQRLTGFPFLVSAGFTRDRVYHGDLLIEVCYTARTKDTWRGLVARAAADLIGRYEDWLGDFPHGYLTIVSGSVARPSCGPEQLLVLPEDIKDTLILETALAVEMARCWFSPFLPADSGPQEFLDESLAYYVAGRILLEKHGAAASDMVRAHRDIIFGSLTNAQDHRRVAVNAMTQIPIRMHALSALIGDSLLVRGLKLFLERSRHRRVTTDDFLAALPRTAVEALGFIPYDDGWPELDFDLAVSTVTIVSTKGGCEVHYEISNGGSVALPTEVGFVMSATDTVYDTLRLSAMPEPGQSRRYCRPLTRRPRAVVLDPNYLLPDGNRDNNYFFTLPRRFRQRPPRVLFPPYDFIE